MDQPNTLIFICSVCSFLIGIGATLTFTYSIKKKNENSGLNQILNDNLKKNEILTAIIRTQEEERNRIATNLHDSVGAELSMLKLNLSKYAYFFKQAQIDAEPFLKDINNLDDTIEHITVICRDLYPVSLTSLGFIKNFENLMSRINNIGKITCKYRIVIRENEFPEDMDYKLGLLRVFQELLNNVIKYSGATFLDIGFIKEGDLLKILFKHNGVAFDNLEAQEKIMRGEGVGLQSIQNRIYLMNGQINYLNVNNGAEVILSLPLTHGRQNKNLNC